MEDGENVDRNQSLVVAVALLMRAFLAVDPQALEYNQAVHLIGCGSLDKDSKPVFSNTALVTFLESRNVRCTFAMAGS